MAKLKIQSAINIKWEIVKFVKKSEVFEEKKKKIQMLLFVFY